MSTSSTITLAESVYIQKNEDGVTNTPTRRLNSNKQLTGAAALTVKQSIFPVSFVTVLFFLWGFSYGLVDTLNAKFQEALDVSAAQAGGLQGAYFGAYFIGPLTYSGWIVRRFGYRWAFITGLCLYGIGSLLFWPSAVYKSFAGFCGSLFVVGSGLSTLETAANPYVATCGPPRLAELRLQLSQAVQAIGIVAAPLLASRVFFKHNEIDNLSHLQWTYVGIAGFVFLMAVLFFLFPIPEITDKDMASQAEQCAELTGYVDKPLSKQYKLFFGVFAMFCYCGGQVTVATQFINYTIESAGVSHAVAADRYAIAEGLFAIGRFLAAGLFVYVKPRYVLMAFTTGVVVFTALAIGVYGQGGVAMLSLVLFFESCVFPTTFSLTMRGLGRHSKRGGSWLVAAISGGALFPALTGLVADTSTYHKAMAIPLIAQFFSFLYAVYLNVVCVKELDGFRETRIGYDEKGGKSVGEQKGDNEKTIEVRSQYTGSDSDV